jgi:hypothetical protein
VGLTHFRLEFKYRVPADRLGELRRRLPPGGFRRYAMTTTYLDREDGALAEAARRAPHKATKVRLREYWESGGALWMEVKLRTGSWTRKWRFPVPKASVHDLLRGADPGELLPVHRTHFSYPKEQVRFSLDEDVAYYRAPVPLYTEGRTLDPASLGWPLRVEPDAILELKDAGGGPGWCREVVDGLQGTLYSKFGTLLSCLDRG